MSDYRAHSDTELIDLLRKSDPAAFTEIFRRYRSLLFFYTSRRLEEIEHAKDLVHDVFADFWEKRETIHIPGELRPFLLTVVKNRILDYYKHQKVSQRYLDEFNAYLQKYDNDTDHLVRKNELSARIEDAMSMLPEKMRQVFELSRMCGMSRKEISEHLNIPQETVNSRMRHALQILREKLGLIILIIFIVAYNQCVNNILTFF